VGGELGGVGGIEITGGDDEVGVDIVAELVNGAFHGTHPFRAGTTGPETSGCDRVDYTAGRGARQVEKGRGAGEETTVAL
jgi:hypothetical protein